MSHFLELWMLVNHLLDLRIIDVYPGQGSKKVDHKLWIMEEIRVKIWVERVAPVEFIGSPSRLSSFPLAPLLPLPRVHLLLFRPFRSNVCCERLLPCVSTLHIGVKAIIIAISTVGFLATMAPNTPRA